MGRISNIPQKLPELSDSVIGFDENDADASFEISGISKLARDSFSNLISPSSLVSVATNAEELIASGISQEVNISQFGNVLGTTALIGVWLRSPTEIIIGANIASAVFAVSYLANGARVSFYNGTEDRSAYSTVQRIDQSQNLIVVSEPLDILLSSASGGGLLNNQLTIFQDGDVTIRGDVMIEGSLEFEGTVLASQLTNTNTGETQPMQYWLGTEAEYQTLLVSGLINDNTIYDTY